MNDKRIETNGTEIKKMGEKKPYTQPQVIKLGNAVMLTAGGDMCGGDLSGKKSGT